MISITLSPSSQWGRGESVVGSGLESCRNERVPCSSGDSLVDHLALDRADAFDVLGENLACSLHRLGARRERRVDRIDLCGVDGGLMGEAKRHRGGYLLFQARFVMQIEEGRADWYHTCPRAGGDEAATQAGEERLPGKCRAQTGRHVRSTKHKTCEPRRCRRDRF